MKITLLCSGYESIGLEYISACLKKNGCQTILVFEPALFYSGSINNNFLHHFFSYRDIVIKQVIDSHPDIVGFSVISDSYGWACEIAREIKKRMDVPVVFGGIHPTSVPEIVIQEDFVDYVCVGEGEEAMAELVEAIEKGKDTTSIKNIWAKKDGGVIKNSLRPLISDLDSLPFPDKRMFYKEYGGYEDTYCISSGRGCIYSCSFCCHSFLKAMYQGNGSYYRRRSVENVIDELRLAKENFKMKSIFFCDDLFLHNKEWIKNFCRGYKEFIALPFACEAHPDYIDDEMAELISSSGCVTVGMGVESVDEEVKREMLHRYEKNSQVLSAIAAFKKTNIFLCVDLLIAASLQDESSLLDTARFFNRHKPDFIFPFWLRYYPEMEILKLAGEKGMLSPADIEQIKESRSFCPFRGNIFNKKTGRIANFLLISYLFPAKVLEMMIKNKVYRYFPAGNIFFFHLIASLVMFQRRMFSGKKRLVLSTMNQLKFYISYIVRRITVVI